MSGVKFVRQWVTHRTGKQFDIAFVGYTMMDIWSYSEDKARVKLNGKERN